MKWLPEPREPSCVRQFGAISSACLMPALASSSSIFGPAHGLTAVLYFPALSGIAAVMDAWSA